MKTNAKKLLSLLLAALMLLSLAAAAMAEGEPAGTLTEPVVADGNNVVIYSNVTVDSGTAVTAQNGGSVTVGTQTATNVVTGSENGAYAEGTGSSVTVYGIATAKKEATIDIQDSSYTLNHTAGARASDGGEVTVYGTVSNTAKGNGKGVVEDGKEIRRDAYAAGALAETGGKVTVEGDVTSGGRDNNLAAYAIDGGTVIINGDVSANGTAAKAEASGGSDLGGTIIINGDMTVHKGNAAIALTNSTIEVHGKISDEGVDDAASYGAHATGGHSKVIVYGDTAQSDSAGDTNQSISEDDTAPSKLSPSAGYAVYIGSTGIDAELGGTVEVHGNVYGGSTAVIADGKTEHNALAIVSGDISTAPTSSSCVESLKGGTVIVEGTINGNIINKEDENDTSSYGTVYAGALSEEVDSETGIGTGASSQAANLAGFLVGLANDGDTVLDINEFFDISGDIVPSDASTSDNITDSTSDNITDSTSDNTSSTTPLTIGGVSRISDDASTQTSRKQYYVASADFSDPSNPTKEITLKYTGDKDKFISFTAGSFNSDNFVDNQDGTYTLTYNSLGGMNALVLMLTPAPEPGPSGDGGDDTGGDSGGSGDNTDTGPVPQPVVATASSVSPAPAAVVVVPYTLEPYPSGRGVILNCNTLGSFNEAQITGAFKVMVDYKEVEHSCYSVTINKDGNIEVSFTSTFFKSLSGGVHMVTVVLSSGIFYTCQMNVPFSRSEMTFGSIMPFGSDKKPDSSSTSISSISSIGDGPLRGSSSLNDF